MPLVSPGLAVLLFAVLVSAGFVSGFLGVGYDDGQLTLRAWRSGRLTLTFNLRDTWFLLVLVLSLDWSVGAAVEHSAWVTASDKLVPALLTSTLVGWALASSRLRKAGYILLTVPAIAIQLALLLADQVGGRPGSFGALWRWLSTATSQPQLGLLAGLLFLLMVTGYWTSWWAFRRRNGLVALLPSGTVLAVEILNDPSPGMYFYTLFWLVTATSILLRLNFVGLKERWRSRRVPRAADTGWVFGEIGFEATAILLVAAFLLPPLSTEDLSTSLFPGTIQTDRFPHIFGFDFGKGRGGGPLTVGYSETVRPGVQLKEKSQQVMVVTGDSPGLYPYLRGIALGGWNGLSWYQLPPSGDLPVLDQPRLEPRAPVSRDDLPQGPHLNFVHITVRTLVPVDQMGKTVFSTGEIVWVDNHPTSVRGIVTTLFNADGPPSPFDTVDVVRLVDSPRFPYSYGVYAAIPNADESSLRQASTDYPAWLEPYRQVYFFQRGGAPIIQASTSRDGEITALAQNIVRDAHATNPYDEAKAIEAYLRAPGRFTYTLTPKPAPAGVRPLDNFLFDSKQGLCQDFSTAMGVMLRSLQIPVRQMSGFSLAGNFDEKTNRYLVNALDAHSWVDVFFPQYGWIPFEPTPDNANSPIARPATPADLTAPLPAPGTTTGRNRADTNPSVSQDLGGGVTNQFSGVWSGARWLVVALLILGLLALLLMFRWLMSARDARRIWRRLQFLADRLHVPRPAGDTPKEFGARLAAALPPFETEVRSLADLYTRANFRRGGLTSAEMRELQRTWHTVRRRYPALVAGALRNRGKARALRPGVASASRSRVPAPPR